MEYQRFSGLEVSLEPPALCMLCDCVARDGSLRLLTVQLVAGTAGVVAVFDVAVPESRCGGTMTVVLVWADGLPLLALCFAQVAVHLP